MSRSSNHKPKFSWFPLNVPRNIIYNDLFTLIYWAKFLESIISVPAACRKYLKQQNSRIPMLKNYGFGS